MRELLDIFWSFLKIGAFTFGGGYAMLPIIEKEVVDKNHWLTKEEFLDSGILGKGTQHYKIQEYFGDFVIVSKSDKAIRYTIDGNKADRLLADHAGITRDEMVVPVIVIAN